MSALTRHSIKVIIVSLLTVLIGLAMVGCSSSFSESQINELYAKPGDFKGKSIKNLNLQIVAVDKVKGEVHLQGFQNFRKHEHPTVVILDKKDISYEEGEFIKVKGEIIGGVTVVDEEGVEMTAVKIKAKKITKIKSTEAIPAEDSIEARYDVKENGITGTIDKIDFTSDEIRVYLKVKNSSNQKVEIFPEHSFVEQDGNKYEVDVNNNLYEDVQINKLIKSGESVSGVIVFKRIDRNLPFNFTLEGIKGNKSEFSLEFNFENE